MSSAVGAKSPQEALKGGTEGMNVQTAAGSPRAAAHEQSGSEAHRRFLLRITIISTLGGLLFGYDTGVISGALLYMRDDLGLGSVGEGFVVSSLLVGAAFGALLGGRIADDLGRKRSLMVCAVLFLLGALGTATAPSVELMVVSRVVLGLAVGAASVTVPLFLAEMAPANRRGRIVTINELMIVSGQLLAFTVNAGLDRWYDGPSVWRWMLAIAAIPAVLLFVGMLFLPDSPRWYALKGRLGDTRRVLGLTRPPHEADEEYDCIAKHAKRDVTEDKGAALRDLRAYPWMRRILFVGIGLAIVQQATGINTAIYYAPTTLESTGLGASASLVATIAVGVIGVTMTVVGIVLLGFMNRRPLLLTGFSGVAASQLALALCFELPESTTRSYLVLAGMVLFVAFVQCFIGIGVWLLLSEIFPLAIRGFAMGIAVFVLWATNATISFVFPLLRDGVGPTATFGIFVLINLVSVLFVAKCVPETRGRTLEELEDEFRAHRGKVVVRTAPVSVQGS
jgi:major inositol transporter-like SP family MFS transporter